MVIDRIKISQEINFMGMPTWIGIEGTLVPDEDVLEGLRTIQKKITDYQQEEQKAYGQSKWAKINDEVENKGDAVESIVKTITACSDITVLKTFDKLAKSNTKFQEAYDNTMKLLTNKTD